MSVYNLVIRQQALQLFEKSHDKSGAWGFEKVADDLIVATFSKPHGTGMHFYCAERLSYMFVATLAQQAQVFRPGIL